jgi:trimethylamine--corrinoid protein Co-methyltransferase
MPQPKIQFLSDAEIQDIHYLSLKILRETGVVVHHAGVLDRLAAAGARVDFSKKLVRFEEQQVMAALAGVPGQYVVRGRDPARTARFGFGDLNMTSSPGQYAWFDHHTGARRPTRLADAVAAARVGEALANVTIVGAMSAPEDVPLPVRDVVLTAELIRHTGKPTRCWPITRRSSHYVLEIYAALAGGREALRREPMVETFLEPVSPLQLPETGLDVMLEYLEYGQPVSIGPMVMASGTGPATLAGTLAQENAEILAGITVVQTLSPGNPITYGGIPHIMDPRTSICAFGSPEQGLLAVAMAQMAKFYHLPVYLNINLTDAKLLDAQAGMEKIGSFLLGAMAGADLIGHAGIVGTDHGGSLAWLVADHEAVQYVRRVLRGFCVDEETLAGEVIAATGPAGSYVASRHTLRHFRGELWIPSRVWTRETYDGWFSAGGKSLAERAAAQVDEILAKPLIDPLEPGLAGEIERIVAAARRELADS